MNRNKNLKIAMFAMLGLSLDLTQAELKNVLIYSFAEGYRHDVGIRDGNALLDTLAKTKGFTLFKTEDGNYMTYENMKKYDVILFNNTTGAALSNPASQAAFIKYLNEGGGWIGFHGAMDHHSYWQWYTDQGVVFNGHTGADAMVKVDTMATKKAEYADMVKLFPKVPWLWREEWYSFKSNPRVNADILLTVDEKTFVNAAIDPKQVMGDHPVAWAKTLPALPGSTKQGRYLYMAIGHGGYGKCFKTELYVNEFVYQAFRWAAGEQGPVTNAQQSKILSRTETNAVSAEPAQLDVSVSELGKHSVEVFNMQGRKVESVGENGPSTHVFSNLDRQTIYFIKISAAKRVTTKRVFVQ
jgi:uncharacterized protein